MRRLTAILAPLLLCANAYGAKAFAVRTLEGGDAITTEAATNVVFFAGLDELRIFSLSLELDATPSNCVEVAFGRDADGDGNLSPVESAFALGWDCGAWFVRDEADGDELREGRESGRRTLVWRLTVGERGNAISLRASDGGPLFSAASSHPSRSWYDRSWDLAKVKVRGLAASAERISAAVCRQGLAVIVR